MVVNVDNKYTRYANMKSKLVTTLPIEVIANKNMKTENAKCKILKYTHPRKYKIEFAGGFYNHNKNNTYEIEQIIDHELAHVKYPYTHGLGFKRLAKKLGASSRYQQAR